MYAYMYVCIGHLGESPIDAGYNSSAVTLEPPKHNGVPYDSVIGEVTPFGSTTKYTSVTVYNTDQVYPEYLIYYNRQGTIPQQQQLQQQQQQQQQPPMMFSKKQRAVPNQ